MYEDCVAAVHSFEHTVSTLDESVVRDRLHSLGAQLPPLLAVADRLARAAAEQDESSLGERLHGLRSALKGMAADCDRIAVLLRADPGTADLGDELGALGAGLVEARRHGWTPVSPVSGG